MSLNYKHSHSSLVSPNQSIGPSLVSAVVQRGHAHHQPSTYTRGHEGLDVKARPFPQVCYLVRTTDLCVVLGYLNDSHSHDTFVSQ